MKTNRHHLKNHFLNYQPFSYLLLVSKNLSIKLNILPQNFPEILNMSFFIDKKQFHDL